MSLSSMPTQVTLKAAEKYHRLNFSRGHHEPNLNIFLDMLMKSDEILLEGDHSKIVQLRKRSLGSTTNIYTYVNAINAQSFHGA